MGKATGFLEYQRKDKTAEEPLSRIRHYNEFRKPLSKEEQEFQGARCMACGVPFCQYGDFLMGMTAGCPLHNLAPEWNDLIYRGNWKEAYLRLIKTNNFPEFTSRVCPALCEKACTCNIYDDPVTCQANEYSIIENAYREGYTSPKRPVQRSGKHVAVIGSGPAGMAAADQLNRRGHSVAVYERSDRIGGLLRYGIPNMKLDKKILDRKIEIMKKEGITFYTDTDAGTDVTKEELMSEYDAVILACGASKPRDIHAPGRNLAGIYFAVPYLSSITKSLLDSNLEDGRYISAEGRHVVIIGGGDTGNDCVASAIRQKAASVLQVEMMPEPPKKRARDNPWPEWPKIKKTDYGQEEAAALFGSDPRIYTTTVKEFLPDDNGTVKKVQLVKLEFTKNDSGKMVPHEVPDSEYTVDGDFVLIAAGFLGCEEQTASSFGVEITDRGCVMTKPGAFAAREPGIFAAGDMHRGQSLVVWAIREGRDAAAEVDEYLMGYTNLHREKQRTGKIKAR